MTLAKQVWSDPNAIMQTAGSSAPAELSQIFEPIRDELEAVEQAYTSHIQSRVDLIPRIGRYIQTMKTSSAVYCCDA